MANQLIALTGGGTAGHVMPHIAMLPAFYSKGWQVFYIGSAGIERDLLSGQDLKYFQISTGKLRRYFSWQNFRDVFRVAYGILQSLGILWRCRPVVVYCKGGFVSVPVAIAARILRIPVVSHESDYTPGLANRVIGRFAKEILYAFPETKKYLTGKQITCVGIPVRKELFGGDREKAQARLKFFNKSKPVVLFMGGSLGAQAINEALQHALPRLTEHYQVIHITGQGKSLAVANDQKDYYQVEFVSEGLEDLLAFSDVVVSRSGANTIFELLALAKPMLLIPLQRGSRGDQLDNAHSFAQHGWAKVVYETWLTPESLLEYIDQVWQQRETMTAAQKKAFPGQSSESMIVEALQKYIQ